MHRTSHGMGMMLAALLFSSWSFAAEDNFVPPPGLVPDEQTAVAIARAIWQPIYGPTLEDEEPFVATLKEGVWHVHGTLPPGAVGGTAEAEISKIDGCILRVSHGK